MGNKKSVPPPRTQEVEKEGDSDDDVLSLDLLLAMAALERKREQERQEGLQALAIQMAAMQHLREREQQRARLMQRAAQLAILSQLGEQLARARIADDEESSSDEDGAKGGAAGGGSKKPSTLASSSGKSMMDGDRKLEETETIDDQKAQQLLKVYQSSRDLREKEILLIDRENLFESARVQLMVLDFNIRAVPHIRFNGEEGIDLGGPTREFFRELTKSLHTLDIFEGNPQRVTFTYDLRLLDEEKYFVAGLMTGWAILHTGLGISCLHPYVYAKMMGASGRDPPVSVEDVPDATDQENIRKLALCQNEDELKSLKSERFDWLCQCGLMPANLTLRNKNQAVDQLIKHQLFHRIKAAADQFAAGLNRAGMLGLLRKHPEHGRAFFLFKRKKMTAVALLEMVQFAVSRIQEVRLEELQSIGVVKQFIQRVHEGHYPITINNILEFITGSSEVPPGGFDKKITMHFHDPARCRYPVCSTCSFEISIPRGFSLDKMAEVIVEGIRSSPGFGLK